MGNAIFQGQKGASEDSDCFHLGVCQVSGVNVTGCHIGLELLTPIEVGNRCDSRIEEPAPRFSVRNVTIRLPNLCSIVSVTDSDTWVGVFFDLPVPKSSTSGSKCARSARCLFTRKFVLSAISCNANLGLRSGASKANGNIKIAHEFIETVYLLSLL